MNTLENTQYPDPPMILLVEDDQNILQMLEQIILLAGYDLLIATNGQEALDLVKTTQKTIDLLVTDVVMPVMGGEELAIQLNKQFPTMKIILMSGSFYKDTELKKKITAPTITIRKPFSIIDFKNKIAEMLKL